MRGKNTIWMSMVALLIASLLVSSFGVQRVNASPDKVISVKPPVAGNKRPGDTFSVTLEVDFVRRLRGFELKLSWDQRKLKIIAGVGPDGKSIPAPDDPEELGELLEGPFLRDHSIYFNGTHNIINTYATAAKGLAGESVTLAVLIKKPPEISYVTGGTEEYYDPVDDITYPAMGPLATITLEVVAGGDCDLTVTGKLLDEYYNVMTGVTFVDGYFWSPVPFLDFTWFVPTRNASGTFDIEMGPMFYGDLIKLDAASKSYDLNNAGGTGGIVRYRFLLQEGGVDRFSWKVIFNPSAPEWAQHYVWRIYNETYPKGYEGKLRVIDQDVPGGVYNLVRAWGTHPARLYGKILGWHLLTIDAWDADDNQATFRKWIRIMRLSPSRVIMQTLETSTYHLSKRDGTMTFGGKWKNTCGTGLFPPEAWKVYVELGRMTDTNLWGRMRFRIYSIQGKFYRETLYTDDEFVTRTDSEVEPPLTGESSTLYATWEGITDDDIGYYMSYASVWSCISRVAYGVQGSAVPLSNAGGNKVHVFSIRP